jgi:hypothetical protein
MNSKEYRQKYYQENKEKWKFWAESNRERKNEISRKSAKKCKDKRFKSNCNWIENNFERKLFAQARKNAKYKNLEFNLELSDITIPDKCVYLNVDLTTTQGQGFQPTNASLDRIDNSKGYIKGNIQVISALANFMKRNATPEQLISFAKGVLAQIEC